MNPFRSNISLKSWVVSLSCVMLLASCGGDSPNKLIASAKDYMAKGDYGAAVIQLRNALQKAPHNAQAHYMLGTALIERRDPADAEKELRKALELGYPDEEAVPALARALVDRGNAKELVAEFGNKTLDNKDAQAALKTAIGNAQLSLGKPDEAEIAFRAALDARADFPAAQLGIATAKARRGDVAGAKSLVDQIVARPDAPPEALLLKAQILLAEGQSDAARSYLEKVVADKPDYLAARFLLTSLLIGKGELDQASAQVEATKRASKQDRRAFYFEALIAERRGDLPAAREAIQQVLKGGVEHVPSLLLAGEIEFRAKQYNQAQDYLRRALKQSPDLPGAQRLLAATYLRLGTPAKALEVLQQPLKGGNKDPQLMALAGEAYLASGDFQNAAHYFEQTTAMDPKNIAVRTRLGQVKFAEGDTEGAIRDLEAASALDANASSADLALIANLLRQKKTDEALAAIGRLEKKQPNSALVYNLKGLAYMGKRDVTGARAQFEKAVQIQPNYLPAISNLAQLDRIEKKPDAARKRFEALLEKEPNNEQALLAYANLLQSLGGSLDEVESLLKKAVAASPQSVAPRFALTNLYLRKGDAKQALLVAQEANAALPTDPRTLDVLGQVQQDTGNIESAVETFNKLVAARPGTAEPLIRLARALAAAKDYDKAIEKLREALKITPSLLEANREIAVIYVMTNRPEEALTEIKTIQQQQPDDMRGYLLEGDLWANQKKWPEAEAAFRAAQKRAPADGLVEARIHAAMANQGKRAEADAAADKWLRDHPKDVVLHAYLGDRALRTQDYKTAMRHYQAMLAQQPDNPIFLNNAAWAGGELGDPKALSYAEKAFALAPNSSAILDTYGVLLVKGGDAKQGVEKLQKAAQLSPYQSDIRLHLARALIKAGNKEAARKELEALAQASSPSAGSASGSGQDPGADAKAKRQAGATPSLTCSPGCAEETQALLKTL